MIGPAASSPECSILSTSISVPQRHHRLYRTSLLSVVLFLKVTLHLLRHNRPFVDPSQPPVGRDILFSSGTTISLWTHHHPSLKFSIKTNKLSVVILKNLSYSKAPFFIRRASTDLPTSRSLINDTFSGPTIRLLRDSQITLLVFIEIASPFIQNLPSSTLFSTGAFRIYRHTLSASSGYWLAREIFLRHRGLLSTTGISCLPPKAATSIVCHCSFASPFHKRNFAHLRVFSSSTITGADSTNRQSPSITVGTTGSLKTAYGSLPRRTKSWQSLSEKNSRCNANSRPRKARRHRLRPRRGPWPRPGPVRT